jgi:hypothetical protein
MYTRDIAGPQSFSRNRCNITPCLWTAKSKNTIKFTGLGCFESKRSVRKPHSSTRNKAAPFFLQASHSGYSSMGVIIPGLSVWMRKKSWRLSKTISRDAGDTSWSLTFSSPHRGG